MIADPRWHCTICGAASPARLAEAIAEAVSHVEWPEERGATTFGGMTFRNAAQAIAAHLPAIPAAKPEAGLDVERCENCDHRKLDHYFGDALCYEHKAMHTPCIRVARHEAKRCLCHAYSGPEESKP